MKPPKPAKPKTRKTASQLLIWMDKKSGWMRSAMVGKRKRRRITNTVTYGHFAPHPMFGEERTALMRVAFYKEPVACACCGKMKKRHWTTLVPFHAIDVEKVENFLVLDPESGPLHAPLTPVCEDHPIAEHLETMREMAAALRYFWQLATVRMEKEREHAAIAKKKKT